MLTDIYYLTMLQYIKVYHTSRPRSSSQQAPVVTRHIFREKGYFDHVGWSVWRSTTFMYVCRYIHMQLRCSSLGNRNKSWGRFLSRLNSSNFAETHTISRSGTLSPSLCLARTTWNDKDAWSFDRDSRKTNRDRQSSYRCNLRGRRVKG